MEIRVRFAPSPTGYLHVGGARTALYNYLFAKKNGGKFILRIEDTDLERSTEESLRLQIKDLEWLGLKWDEGIDPQTLKDVGPNGPYRQSQRKSIYKEYAEKLIDSGHAYYCFLSDQEIEEQKNKAISEGRPPQVNSPFREGTKEEAQKKIAAGEKPVVRFKTPQEKRDFVLHDLVRGEVTFPSDMVGDFVLIRSNDMPVYNFCCAVDDALMKITHVLRAEEHLSNTLRQMMIYEALHFPLPQFGHLSIILGADKQKLSKRHGATSCNEFRERGYLAESLNNFIALLGWSSPSHQEILSMEQMCKEFGVDRLHAAAAVFDEVKLKWMNAEHLRHLKPKELWASLKPFFDKAGLKFSSDESWQEKALDLFKTSMETLADAVPLFEHLSESDLQFTAESADVLKWEHSKSVIETWKNSVQALKHDFMSEDEFLKIQDQVKDHCAVKGKFLFMPIRVAVIGMPQGAELKHLVPLLHKDVLVKRADQTLKNV